MNKRMEEFINSSKTFYSSEQNKVFEKGLSDLENKYKYFFDKAKPNKKHITNYFTPNRPFLHSPVLFLGISENSGLPKEIELDLISLWESVLELG